MLSRRLTLAAAASLLAAPAILPRTALGQTRKVKIGSAFTTTTNAAFLIPKYLKPHGIEVEMVMFPSLVQRMQAVASGDIAVGNGGVSAVMQLDTKGFPMAVLANGCDGGWAMLGKPGINDFAGLKGKKVAVQQGSIALACLAWKLKHEGMEKDVELVYMDNDKMPIPLYRGDVDAICCFEPYAAFAKVNGWGKVIWDVYDTPMGKTNLVFCSSLDFIKKEPDLTKLIVQAHVAATKEIIAHPEIALETTMKQFNMPKNIAEVSNANLFFSADSGPTFQSGLKNLSTMMIDAKLMDKQPNWDTFINTSFL